MKFIIALCIVVVCFVCSICSFSFASSLTHSPLYRPLCLTQPIHFDRCGRVCSNSNWMRTYASQTHWSEEELLDKQINTNFICLHSVCPADALGSRSCVLCVHMCLQYSCSSLSRHSFIIAWRWEYCWETRIVRTMWISAERKVSHHTSTAHTQSTKLTRENASEKCHRHSPHIYSNMKWFFENVIKTTLWFVNDFMRFVSCDEHKQQQRKMPAADTHTHTAAVEAEAMDDVDGRVRT